MICELKRRYYIKYFYSIDNSVINQEVKLMTNSYEYNYIYICTTEIDTIEIKEE